jgi:hypothetical protein
MGVTPRSLIVSADHGSSDGIPCNNSCSSHPDCNAYYPGILVLPNHDCRGAEDRENERLDPNPHELVPVIWDRLPFANTVSAGT